ncbi:MAG TPA: class I SAM-dependent methyltransferase [Methanocella sp.]|uniref:class I SAM-dependent methyltransferase n=1 Tax=Methanocella sp. TaxID=2052833 RepID=UPI002B973674|nr:class I SAM-dependent methyltransferase [Methanocella sp.]HTY91395.1 class I SAM-dependent methyltransferase [Methanocella sp.]
MQKIDYDYNKFKLDNVDKLTLVLRSRYLDHWTREFLTAHPASTVLHLGCGLDSRVFRIDPPATVRWYDVDYPEVIELRRLLYPERHDYYMIGTSVTDQHWLDGIPVDRPVLVVAEGLVMYLTDKECIDLFKRITGRFSDGQFIFDSLSRLALRLSKLTPNSGVMGAFINWGVDDPLELERSIPRLKLVTEIYFMDMPEYKRLPLVERNIWYMVSHIAFMKSWIRLLRYKF